MAKAPKPNTARKPPVPSDSHVAIAEWSRRVMPDLHPIIKRLDELVCETIPGLQYAVKWKRAYYGLPRLGWIIEMVAYDVSVNIVFFGGAEIQPAAAWNHRTDPLRQGEDPGRSAGTGDAQMDSASGACAGVEMRVQEQNTRISLQITGMTYVRPPTF